MAGYSPGMADLRIRKTLAKKRHDMIPEIRNEFIYGKKSLYDEDHKVIGISEENSPYCNGAVNNGFSEEVAIKVFDAIEKFAAYSFNKSHSSAYAANAYKEAWLSYYYPIEWAIVNLSDKDKPEDRIATLTSCKKRGIKILQSDINKSFLNFTKEALNNGEFAIRYGFFGVKNVGENVVNYIIKIRDTFGPFKSFDDYYNKTHDPNNVALYSEKENKNGSKICPLDKRAETSLINVGAFDEFDGNRYKLMNYYMVNLRKEKDYEMLDANKFSRKDKLRLEKEIIGVYVSEHPLDPFPYENIDNVSDGTSVEIAGIINNTTVKLTKFKKNYLITKMETKDGREVRVMIFGALADKFKDALKKNEIIVVDGTVNKTYNNINATKIRKIVKKSAVIRNKNDEDGITDMRDAQPVNSVQTQTQIPVINDDFDLNAINL